MTIQVKLQSCCTTPKFKYGYDIPKIAGVRLDEKNGNSMWQDATKLGMDQQMHMQHLMTLVQ